MTIYPLSVVAITLIAYGLLGKRQSVTALALSGVAAAGATIAFNGIGIPLFYSVGIPLAVKGLIRNGIRRFAPLGSRSEVRNLATFWTFFGWCTLVTATAPLLFAGLRILSPSSETLVPGVFTKTNIAQITYLAIAILLMRFVGEQHLTSPEPIGTLLGTSIVLCGWSFVSQHAHLPFPSGFFDNSPNSVYIQSAPGGATRFRGIYSEPSALGGTCLVAAVYMTIRACQVGVYKRVGCASVALAAIYLGIQSTSTTFLLAGSIFAGVGLFYLTFRLLTRKLELSKVSAVVLLVAIGLCVLLASRISNFVLSAISAKATTGSYASRVSSNQQTWYLFLDSWGWGVGLGNARGSSFLLSILGSVGFVGTLLLVAAITILVRNSLENEILRPIRWTMVAALMVRTFAGPDLADTSGLYVISFGLFATATSCVGANSKLAGFTLVRLHSGPRPRLPVSIEVTPEA